MTHTGTAKGLLGALISIILPFIEAVSPILQFIGVLLGLYLAWISIKVKYLQKKQLENHDDTSGK